MARRSKNWAFKPKSPKWHTGIDVDFVVPVGPRFEAYAGNGDAGVWLGFGLMLLGLFIILYFVSRSR